MTIEWRPWLILAGAACVIAGCGIRPAPAAGPDPALILRSHISHGIGISPLDSALVHDASAAAMIVEARDCAPVGRLRRLVPTAADGDRLLEQLQTDGLIAIHNERACTTFPLLVGDAQVRYAALTDDLAADAHALLAADIVQILELVERRGWQDWGYHFIWSQLFDSQYAWTAMMQRQLVHPLGRLVAWVVHPGHPFRSGTNYFPDTELRDFWLMVTWRAGAANTVGQVGGSWQRIYGAVVEGRSLSADEAKEFAALDLLDDTGRVQVPHLDRGDPLLDLLESTAIRYIDLLEPRMPLDALTGLSRIDRQHAFAMAYHDVSWGIVERLVVSGVIQVPPALAREAASGRASMRGVAALSPVHPPFADMIRDVLERR
jgi:hypothetical protein